MFIMVDSLRAEKKSPWSKPLVMGVGLVIVAVLIVGIYAPDVFKLSSGGQTGGKIYQRDTGVLGFMTDILSYKGQEANPYVIVWAPSLDGSSAQTSAIGFVGEYGVTKSRVFNNPENPIPDTDKIVIANKEDDTLVGNLFTKWSSTKDAALVYIDQDKRSLTILGTSSLTTSYAINFLKMHGTERSCFAGKETATILIIPNNAGCDQVYSPRAKLSISSNTLASVSLKTSTGGPTFSETGQEYLTSKTPQNYNLAKGDYKVSLTAPEYTSKEEIISISLEDQLQEKLSSKSYTLTSTVTTGSVEIQVGADTGAPLLSGATVTLEGQNLVKPTVSGIATFNNLNPGPYTFTIRPTESYYSQKSVSATVVVGQTVTVPPILYRASDVTCQPTYDNPQYGACINKIKSRTLTKIAGADGIVCPVGEQTRPDTANCCLEAYTQCGDSDWTPVCSSTIQVTQTRPCNIVSGCEQSTDPVPQKSRQCSSPSQATVIFTTYPAEASLTINEVAQQKQLPLGAGTYNIKVSLAGYDDLVASLIITQNDLGKTVNVPEYVLTPHSDFVFDRIKNTKNVDKYSLTIGTEINGHKASLSDNIGGSDIAGYLGVSEAYTDVNVPQTSNNLILVGGPCVNNKVAALAASGKFPYTCSSWPGGDKFVIIKQIKTKGESVIVIAGTNAEDTRRGGRIVARLAEFRGKLGKQEVKLCPTNQDVNSADYKDINKIQDCAPPTIQECAQVITYGIDGAGNCKEYPNSCLPPGITKVNSCLSTTANVVRTVQASAASGTEIEVKLDLVLGGSSYYALEERSPVGWEIKSVLGVSSGECSIGDGQTVGKNILRCVQVSGAVNKQITYKVKLPTTVSGSYSFSGEYGTQQGASTKPTTGASAISVTSSSTNTLTITANLGPATVGTSYSSQVSATGGSSPYKYLIQSGNFPAGLAFSESGAISGTPTVSGTFTFTVLVNDSLGQISTKALTIVVSASTPQLSSGVGGPYTNTANTQIIFSGSGSGGVAPYTYSWSFGDGSTSNQQNPSHAYTSVGTYTVSLTITDSTGITATKTTTATISAQSQPLSTTTSGPTAKNAFAPAAFTSSVSGGTTPYTYLWNFGDCTENSNSCTSTVQNPTHSYTNAQGGVYTITFTVTDSAGHTNSTTRSITVFPSV